MANDSIFEFFIGFLLKNRSKFENRDACVSIALNMEEIPNHELHIKRRNFFEDKENETDFEKFKFQISPSPKFSKNPAKINPIIPKRGEHTLEVLKEMGITSSEIEAFSTVK